jgi:CheY-like chemotaxis protein
VTSPRILVADDDKVISLLVCSTLRKAGYSPIPAFDAMQALMFAMRDPQPEAIILDLNMPGGGGLVTLKKLKSSARTTGIPVLVLSGDSDAEVPAMVMDLGAQSFLSKPLVADTMLDELDRILGIVTARPKEVEPPGHLRLA